MALITVDPGKNDMKSIMGKIVLFGLLGLGGWGLYKVLPALISFTENMLYLGFMVSGAAVVLWWLASGGAKAIKYAVYGIAQFSLGWVIEMNPFNILQYRLDEAAETLKTLLKFKSSCSAKEVEIHDKINENDKALQIAMSSQAILENMIASGNASENDKDNLEIVMATITRTSEYIQGMKPTYDSLLQVIDYTSRAYRTGSLDLKKSKSDLDSKRDLYETVTTVSATVDNVWKALKGDDSTNADAEKAIQFLTKDITAKIGNIKTGIKITSQLMDSKDLENAAKMQNTLNQLKNVDLNTQTYSSTLNTTDSSQHIEYQTGTVNKYSGFLLATKK